MTKQELIEENDRLVAALRDAQDDISEALGEYDDDEDDDEEGIGY